MGLGLSGSRGVGAYWQNPEGMVGVMPPVAGTYPNYDSATNALQFANDTILFHGGRYAVLSATNITLPTESSAVAVYYDFDTAAFSTGIYSAAPDRNAALVAAVRRAGSSTTMAMSCPATVNGVLPGERGIAGEWAAVHTPATGDTTIDTMYPDYNTSTQVFTFPKNTVFYHDNDEWVLSAEETVDLSTLGSTASKIYWDKGTDTLVKKASVTTLSLTEKASYVLVATVRRLNGPYAISGISCLFTYTIDGRMFNSSAVHGEENRVGAAVEGIAHQGMKIWFPENTLAAWRGCARRKNYCIETDVRWTSDGVPVMLHDASIDRTSDGTGDIDSMTLATAQTYDFGSHFNAAYSSETIPTFEQSLVLWKKLDMYAYVEIKPTATLSQIQQLLGMIDQYGMHDRVALHSTDSANIDKVISEDPTMTVGLVTSSMTSANITTCAGWLGGSNRVFCNAQGSSITAALVEEAHDAGVDVFVWIINTEADVVSYAEMGVDGVVTDNINVARALRNDEFL